ncbi:MAG TPA: heavy metal-responsive transcriptional regulator [Pyrinomonadaceae bacterium]
MATQTGLRSGELARLAGVSTDTLRHYERKGVLAAPRRSANGYRVYPAEALERVRLVRRALSVGFTLDELASILRERELGRAPCRQVRELAASKLASLEERLREMLAVRDELKALLKDWDTRLTRTPAGQRAALLDALATHPRSNREGNAALAPAWRKRKAKRRKSNDED